MRKKNSGKSKRMSKQLKHPKSRDMNILKAFMGELNLKERKIPNKKRYTRKNTKAKLKKIKDHE